MTDKYCINCKYVKEEEWGGGFTVLYCDHTSSSLGTEPVRGESLGNLRAYLARKNYKGRCGPSGIYYEPAPPKPEEAEKKISWFKRIFGG